MPQSKQSYRSLRPSLTSNSLRGDQDSLRQLKEQLCILWGNLEEHKSAALQQQTGGNPNSSTPPSLDPESSDPRPWRKAGEQPDLDSEEENETSQLDSGAAVSGQKSLGELDTFNAKSQVSIPTVSNKAFTCCIKQYGVKVKEDDPSKANAGNGTKWKRMFGLFGTRIV
jgi:protection-of-telomeres protein 1